MYNSDPITSRVCLAGPTHHLVDPTDLMSRRLTVSFTVHLKYTLQRLEEYQIC